MRDYLVESIELPTTERSTLSNWLTERKSLLSQYCKIAGINVTEAVLPTEADLSQFCGTLMDYVSAGHFEIFAILTGDKTKSNAVHPTITSTTDVALAFNDRYVESSQIDDPNTFESDIAALGELLEERFSIEDKMLESFFKRFEPT